MQLGCSSDAAAVVAGQIAACLAVQLYFWLLYLWLPVNLLQLHLIGHHLAPRTSYNVYTNFS